MAQTTTAINACNAVLMLDDDGGTPVNISGSSSDVTLKLSRAQGKGVTFEGDWNFVLECKKDGSIDLSVMYTTNAAEARALLLDWFETGGNRTFSVYPNGNGVGENYFTGEFKLGDLSFPFGAGEAGPVVIKATLQPDGAISFSTVTS